MVNHYTTKNNRETFSQVYLKKILDYNPATGVFVWKYRDNFCHKWNGKWPGRVAGRGLGSLNKGRVEISINQQKYQAGRLAWLYMMGEWPLYEIDHIDGNPSNNKWENLRSVIPSQNQFNRGKSKNNTSGHKGISWDKSRGKWAVKLNAYKKKHFIGRFENKQDAIAAYAAAQSKCHGLYYRGCINVES